MTKKQQFVLFLLRVSMGWVFFYAGITKILNPNWSAAGYLKTAKTFTPFYHWLTTPGVLPVTNFLNEWGLTLIGAAIILGIAVKLSSTLGAAMMVLYYFPGLIFPKIGTTAYIVDEHIIYALVFLTLGALQAGQFWGLGQWFGNISFLSQRPKLKNFLS